MYQIVFYVPVSHLESVKAALFAAGAGRIGDYDCCAWQSLGEGQFRPLEHSQAFIGRVNKLEKLAEYKVEMVCAEVIIKSVLRVLVEAHPYETPAYSVVKVQTLEDF